MEIDTKRNYPVLPIRNTVVYPGITLPLRVGRPKSIKAVEAAQKEREALILLVTVKNHGEDDGEAGTEDIYHSGVLARVDKVRGNAENGYQVIVRGLSRVRLADVKDEAFLESKAEPWTDKSDLDPQVEQALLVSLKELSQEILKLLPTDTQQLGELVAGIDDLSYLSWLCASHLEIPLDKKQELLEQDSVKARVLSLLELLQHQKESLQVQSEIRDKLTRKLGSVQREAILRQHLDAIREELGEGASDSATGGNDGYRKKIEASGMSAEVKKIAIEELKRLETIPSQSPESHVIRNYLDLLCAMPWAKSSGGEVSLEKAKEVLEKDHYGLEKVKKRILQSLAVMKLKKTARAPILLFVGPPGVGKTSLGASIAKALGRKFVRGSLGGVRDDAEIRGHRRTYIGAMPGRVIQGIKRAGENDPVFMLDEIDKLARGFQGDPASALLETLDPEQNATFLDHYLDVPFDLSKVLFIATANSLESIPGPLLDRMEVIELSGYTMAEKFHIAKNHLVPKQLEAHGLDGKQVVVQDDALMQLITHYTREAGVRDLERQVAAVARGMTEKVLVEGTELPLKVGVSDLDELLGPERFIPEVAERIAVPGVVTGLAWTPMGGEILFIEAGLMNGSGKLTITGQLGDVMKESAQIAHSLVRSRLTSVMAPGVESEKRDLHIHVPAGAIPKDGPSAGIALFTTLASLYSGRSVSPKLAMTGEVTLRGAVMPVGGIKEKVIAAHRAGIERILLPKRNQRDLKEVPEEVKAAVKFDFVENVGEVLKLALGIEETAPGAGYNPPASAPLVA